MDRVNQQEQQVRRVLIGTPCYDGKIEVWHANSLVQTIKASVGSGVDINPIWLSYDALIQRARNDLMAIMLEGGFDDIVFIDADIDWEVQDFFKLLSHPVDVVGGTYRKKGDAEMYVAKILDSTKPADPQTGLYATDGLGTGFLRLSRKAVQYLWDVSEHYEEIDQGKVRRMIFEVLVKNGDLWSEDITICQKLIDGGFTIWLDTSITCGHTGMKRYTGDFNTWFNNLRNVPAKNNAVGYGASIPPEVKSLYE